MRLMNGNLPMMSMNFTLKIIRGELRHPNAPHLVSAKGRDQNMQPFFIRKPVKGFKNSIRPVGVGHSSTVTPCQ
ncbi:hypothetical protein AA0229_2728 [Gluconobacter cerinus NRIC 0229]|nr:hypothetical protein AA0229_2728 [Gluconobacter cerinus NRIC 0229]